MGNSIQKRATGNRWVLFNSFQSLRKVPAVCDVACTEFRASARAITSLQTGPEGSRYEDWDHAAGLCSGARVFPKGCIGVYDPGEFRILSGQMQCRLKHSGF